MSILCNSGGGGGDDIIQASKTVTLAERTELEVELGSAAFAEGFRSVLSAITAIEYREFSLVEGHIVGALDAIQGTLKHYSNVSEIDPHRGMTQTLRDSLASLDLTNAQERWTQQGLFPDFQAILGDISKATGFGNPAEMLDVFTKRVENVKALMEEARNTPQIPKVVYLMWPVVSALVDALMAGQLVAIINSEAHGRLQAS